MNNKLEKLLIVEDDRKIARILELQLKHNGYEVEMANDGRQGEDLFNRNQYDLIILDVMLPLVNGYELCSRIRKKSDVPIIMLTAKDDVTDKILGLDFGANDYMTKPFDIKELMARIRAQLRQNFRQKTSELITIDDLLINLDTMQVSIGDRYISFTKTEFDLFSFLARNRGIVLKREIILQKVWGYDYFGNDNVLDVYIKYIRDKLEKPPNRSIIETVRGVGYVIR